MLSGWQNTCILLQNLDIPLCILNCNLIVTVPLTYQTTLSGAPAAIPTTESHLFLMQGQKITATQSQLLVLSLACRSYDCFNKFVLCNWTFRNFILKLFVYLSKEWWTSNHLYFCETQPLWDALFLPNHDTNQFFLTMTQLFQSFGVLSNLQIIALF